MRKFFLSSLFTLVFTGYVLYQNDSQQVSPAVDSAVSLPISQNRLNAEEPIHPPAKPPAVAREASATPKQQTPKKTIAAVSPAPAPAPAANPTPAPAPAPAPAKKSGMYNDGVFTGPAVDAYYGSVQVEALIQSGKLVDVKFLQYPRDQRTSQNINSQAMPYLKSEAIQAQSANVNMISGATFTSKAFRQSLSSALSQARA